MRCRRSAFALNGNRDAPAWWRGLAPASPYPKPAQVGDRCNKVAERFCRSHDELRNFLRPRTRHNQPIAADRRRLLHLRRATAVLGFLEAM